MLPIFFHAVDLRSGNLMEMKCYKRHIMCFILTGAGCNRKQTHVTKYVYTKVIRGLLVGTTVSDLKKLKTKNYKVATLNFFVLRLESVVTGETGTLS